jgi:hypothetical protein
VAQLLVLLLVSGVDSHLLGQGIFVGDCQHFFGRSGILHGELTNQGRVPESFLEEHDNGFVIDLRNDVYLVEEEQDKFPEGLSFILYNVGQVPFDSYSCARGPEVLNELLAQVGPLSD